MWQDPIVAETRSLRDEYVRQFNYNINEVFKDLMEKQAAHPERIVALSPRKPAGSTVTAQQYAPADARTSCG
uniref:Uncharacterized protein n=1 Tax=Candidatus Kentrum sp. TUN TaxID=2126343 RepID=A0A451A600_9GAMM|nr:MAG: hypothetical protein BECKTUN1418F_GA0071002_10343 [Candidatus Kentron sp. TUN]VFK55933.1 MAG: hypothetical protein BECKTUN1418E_GA0071001_10352 [Candidatus Kentron sp. TUN]VFK61467.1 MAG: hypothetical protein BECKTUN1418D_GA0071000_11527 [Candidatus Kentron sp. TUN]